MVGKLLESENPDLGYDAAKGNIWIHNNTVLFNRDCVLFYALNPKNVCINCDK